MQHSPTFSMKSSLKLLPWPSLRKYWVQIREMGSNTWIIFRQYYLDNTVYILQNSIIYI